MSLNEAKITQEMKNIQSLPTEIRGRADWLKAQFDAGPETLRQAHNKLIDAIQEPDAAAQLGAVVPGAGALPEDTPGSVQGVVEAVLAKEQAHEADSANPHGVTAAQVGAYSKEETDAAIAQKVVEIGAADMTRAVYDPSGRATDIFAVTDALAGQLTAQAAAQAEQAEQVRVFAATLLADGWAETAATETTPAFYTQTVACAGLLAAYDLEAPQVESTGEYAADLARKEALDALCEAGNFGETLDGQLRWICYGGHPTVDLPLRLRRAVVPEAGGDQADGGQSSGSAGSGPDAEEVAGNG